MILYQKIQTICFPMSPLALKSDTSDALWLDSSLERFWKKTRIFFVKIFENIFFFENVFKLCSTHNASELSDLSARRLIRKIIVSVVSKWIILALYIYLHTWGTEVSTLCLKCIEFYFKFDQYWIHLRQAELNSVPHVCR